MPGREPTPAEYRDAAREMDATGHRFLAQELRREADEQEHQPTNDKEN